MDRSNVATNETASNEHRDSTIAEGAVGVLYRAEHDFHVAKAGAFSTTARLVRNAIRSAFFSVAPLNRHPLLADIARKQIAYYRRLAKAQGVAAVAVDFERDDHNDENGKPWELRPVACVDETMALYTTARFDADFDARRIWDEVSGDRPSEYRRRIYIRFARKVILAGLARVEKQLGAEDAGDGLH